MTGSSAAILAVTVLPDRDCTGGAGQERCRAADIDANFAKFIG